ncbi:McrC family protein [Candidatus Nitrosopelagicus sp.]|nr:McrC family protein [Candidatus Nitrosopelagicus sp.]
MKNSKKQTIVLHEHESWSGSDNDSDKIFRKDLVSEDLDVLDKLKEKYGIKHSFDNNDALVIESNQNIGSVQLENLNRRINIVPKMFKDKSEIWFDTSVFLFFANNIKTKEFLKEQKNFFETGSDQLVHPLHITLITRYEDLMNKGLLKSYVLNTENISAVRGKLLFQQQMVNDLMRKPKFFCEYDELEYDSTENRVLLQAMTIVERTSKIEKWKMKALDHAQKLSGVVSKINVSKGRRQNMMRSYNRQNDRYKMIHQTCERLIEHEGIGDIYSGEHSVVPIFYDMNREFEKFVGNLFLKYYEKPNWVKIQNSEDAWSSKGEGTRSMRPDIVIQDENGDVKNIIDVKYKDKGLTTGDLYQLGFYMHEYGKEMEGKELDDAYAILPKSNSLSDKTYTSTRKEKTVHQKILDVNNCLELIKENNVTELQTMVSNLISTD